MLESVKSDVLKLMELYEASEKGRKDALKKVESLKEQIHHNEQQIERLTRQKNALSVVAAAYKAGDGSKAEQDAAKKELKRLIDLLDECLASISE